MVPRNITPDEMRLLLFLMHGAEEITASPSGLLAQMKVIDMDDGGMGSLRFIPEGDNPSGSMFGKRVSACQFTDSDGVEVIASLNVDNEGHLYELDVWKTNFEKLISIPKDANSFRRLDE
jgi:hypothetical protein